MQKNLSEIKGMIFDIDGVLTFQGLVIPGAIEAISSFRSIGFMLRFLTNSTLKSRRSCTERLVQQGFDVYENEVLTASYLTAVFLRNINPRSILLMLEREGVEEFVDFIHDPYNPEYIVVGDNRTNFDFDHLNHAVRVLRKGAKLIGMTSELLDTSMGELELNVGAWVRLLELASSVKATYIGKPNPFAFDCAFQSMNLKKIRLPQSVIGWVLILKAHWSSDSLQF